MGGLCAQEPHRALLSYIFTYFIFFFLNEILPNTLFLVPALLPGILFPFSRGLTSHEESHSFPMCVPGLGSCLAGETHLVPESSPPEEQCPPKALEHPLRLRANPLVNLIKWEEF